MGRLESEQKMYFNLDYVEKIVARQRDYKNNREHLGVSRIFQAIGLTHLKEQQKDNPRMVNLGAGACTDEFDEMLTYLKDKNGLIDWVDHSPFMIELAKKYQPEKFENNIILHQQDWSDWLETVDNDVLDIIFMEYTFNYIDNLTDFFQILAKKMTQDGILIANPNLYPQGLKSETTNALYSINGQMIRAGTTEYPVSGDIIGVHFKTAVDSRQTITSYKIVYRDERDILETAKKFFPRTKILNNWQEEQRYVEEFDNLIENRDLDFHKDKIFLIIKK